MVSLESDDLEKAIHATAEETRKTMLLNLEATVRRLIDEKLKGEMKS